MRKDRFLEAYAEYLLYLHKIAAKAGLDYDEASEVVSKCSESLLETKKYVAITPNKLKAFLHVAIRYAIQNYKRGEAMDNVNCARLPDPELTRLADSQVLITSVVPIIEEETECPFCFKALLNEYGACALCHTILPSSRRRHRTVVQMKLESLSVEFDFNTKIDVQKAIARLTPFEQRVVFAVGLGNETVDSFGDISDSHRMRIWRTWAEAKVKLQEYLKEYAPKKLSKRGEGAFRKALQGIEKQQEFEG
jgi:DNA-directed RNA polymerase specialized sigma24 family protein